MRKLEFEMGQVVPGTQLRVLDYGRKDRWGKQLVKVRCEWPVNGDVDGDICGEVKWMRAAAIKPRPNEDQSGKRPLQSTSCGCQSRWKYREYWEGRAKGIGPLAQREIYEGDVWSGKSFEDLARERRMPKEVVSTAFRLFVDERKDRGA